MHNNYITTNSFVTNFWHRYSGGRRTSLYKKKNNILAFNPQKGPTWSYAFGSVTGTLLQCR